MLDPKAEAKAKAEAEAKILALRPDWPEYLLLSDEGTQQEDSLGPLFFCLTIKRLTHISSELNL